MEFGFIGNLFFVLAAALVGGLVAKFLRLQPIIGYILAGIIFGSILPLEVVGVEKLAEIGIILLLFSIGLELSLSKLMRVFRAATFGAIIQIITVAALSYFFLLALGFNPAVSAVFSLGFSLSSTAVVVKILGDRGETDTIHGEVMIGWLLVQDLAVIPMMVILPVLAKAGEGGWLFPLGRALGAAVLVVAATILLGRKVSPFVVHKVALTNSRELLVISAVALALGTALFVSFFGISPALGAFLAGVVISETQENHAIFAETRPLRDLFVALFFVTLGFLVSPTVIVTNFWLILGLALFVLVLKSLVVFILSFVFGYHGKTAIATSLGLSQIGEFSFIIFSLAGTIDLLSPQMTSIGIATTLITLLVTPVLFKSIVPVWRRAKLLTAHWPEVNKAFIGWDRRHAGDKEDLKNHVIIVGYGRVGSWVGRALDSLNLPFVVIDLNLHVVNKLRKAGIAAIFGDPTEPEILDKVQVKDAKAIVVAIPDRVAQEELITRIQTIGPKVKIISRAHFDEDWEKLRTLKVDKVVQPEFEAAVAIVRSILVSMGKPREEINKRIRSLRLSHTMNTH